MLSEYTPVINSTLVSKNINNDKRQADLFRIHADLTENHKHYSKLDTEVDVCLFDYTLTTIDIVHLRYALYSRSNRPYYSASVLRSSTIRLENTTDSLVNTYIHSYSQESANQSQELRAFNEIIEFTLQMNVPATNTLYYYVVSDDYLTVRLSASLSMLLSRPIRFLTKSDKKTDYTIAIRGTLSITIRFVSFLREKQCYKLLKVIICLTAVLYYLVRQKLISARYMVTLDVINALTRLYFFIMGKYRQRRDTIVADIAEPAVPQPPVPQSSLPLPSKNMVLFIVLFFAQLFSLRLVSVD